MIILQTTRGVLSSWLDADARTYIAAVEAADAQPLETGVKVAINNFVKGCKNDGIWNAIKASCILAGARTLSGALVPLRGTAPTNFNFVSGDYNRKTGLVGNGTTKYLNSNRKNNADPQNNKHFALNVHTASTNAYFGALTTDGTVDGSQLFTNTGGFVRLNSDVSYVHGNFDTVTGFIGINRQNSSQISFRISENTIVIQNASAAFPSVDMYVFARNFTAIDPTSARFRFYSMGESISLTLLNSRVSTLMTNLSSAIP